MDFGMCTDRGNRAVCKIVATAHRENLTWDQTYALLEELYLRDPEIYAGATDETVGELVRDAIAARQAESEEA